MRAAEHHGVDVRIPDEQRGEVAARDRGRDLVVATSPVRPSCASAAAAASEAATIAGCALRVSSRSPIRGGTRLHLRIGRSMRGFGAAVERRQARPVAAVGAARGR